MALTVGKFSEIPFLPAIAPDSNNFASLATGAAASKVFEYLNIQNTPFVARLRNLQLAVPAAAGLSLQLTADGYTSPAIDGIAASKIGTSDPSWRWAWNDVAGQTLRLTVQNSTGAAISNQWFSWGVEIERPSIAQIQQLQQPLGTLPPLTLAQQTLANQYDSGSRGVLPRTLDWIIANEYETQVVDAVVLGKTQAVGTSGPTVFVTEAPRAGEILVLRALWVSPGSGADGLTVQIGIDSNNDVYDIAAYGLGQGTPQPCFFQAQQQVNLQCVATSSVSSVTLAALVWHCRLTAEIRARMANDTTSPTGEKEYVGVI